MTALAARYFPNISTEAVAEFEVVCFFGTVLLISLTVLALDQYTMDEWF